ncbi:conserved hypothetical protein [Leishmania mexicana MHOM/GT/2001/U1103]|uniref:Ubiquitin-like domain-containing protein n=1 Tax=Leishmania mexicana (strain MHOM/GT/2001/U1103) TaxID=929439 RepID=E9ARA5_LEIMU|nr:conserved hypothetical protein [Leishmania mexicana MHOM/GT/2001/U1103]CBZ25492.1 conserved hypothetical protein [Leishmania mexicana MHOM/GT/2001/U1103]
MQQQQPSSNSWRGASRVGSVKYAHSPYAYRTNVDDARFSPLSDQGGRSESASLPVYLSPRSFSASGSMYELPGSHVLQGTQNEGSGQRFSGPSTPLSRSSCMQEYSQPIQVGSAPNVHPRYRRRMQSPITHGCSNDSGSLSGFPNTPLSSLPPRSPFMPRDDSGSTFAGGESAPVRGHNDRYQRNPNGGCSSPRYRLQLSGSSRDAATDVESRSQSPNPHYTAHGTPPPPPPLPVGTSVPQYGARTPSQQTSPTNANGAAASSYAPTGFSVPLKMAPVHRGGSGSYHGSLGGRGGSQSPSYVDVRASHSFPSMMSGGAPPLTFAAALQQQQQSGSFPANNYHGHARSGTYLASTPLGGPGMSGGSAGVTHGAEAPHFSESYDAKTKTRGAMADEMMSLSSKSSSSANSIRDDLPLCPNDDACTLINDRKHQKKFAHTCRLLPCYHGHVARHAKLFRHSSGQVSLPEGVSANMKVSTHALASVNFSTISPEAPNAYRIYVSHGNKSYEIFGDWASVKVHTFKRYLHQVYRIAPSAQILSVVKTGRVMDDDINTVKGFGIEEDSVVQLHSNIEDATVSGRIGISLDDL